MDSLTLAFDTPNTADVRALLERHFALMRAGSPEESCHVMAPDTLLERDAVLVAASGGRKQVLGIGAMTVIAPGHGELKSMHTAAEARGKGVGQAVLTELMKAASDRNLTRLSLETGSADTFAPARALYARNGFSLCDPFGSYSEDPLSVFMTRRL